MEKPPASKAKKQGISPRALGVSPRQLGISPRQLAGLLPAERMARLAEAQRHREAVLAEAKAKRRINDA